MAQNRLNNLRNNLKDKRLSDQKASALKLDKTVIQSNLDHILDRPTKNQLLLPARSDDDLDRKNIIKQRNAISQSRLSTHSKSKACESRQFCPTKSKRGDDKQSYDSQLLTHSRSKASEGRQFSPTKSQRDNKKQSYDKKNLSPLKTFPPACNKLDNKKKSDQKLTHNESTTTSNILEDQNNVKHLSSLQLRLLKAKESVQKKYINQKCSPDEKNNNTQASSCSDKKNTQLDFPSSKSEVKTLFQTIGTQFSKAWCGLKAIQNKSSSSRTDTISKSKSTHTPKSNLKQNSSTSNEYSINEGPLLKTSCSNNSKYESKSHTKDLDSPPTPKRGSPVIHLPNYYKRPADKNLKRKMDDTDIRGTRKGKGNTVSRKDFSESPLVSLYDERETTTTKIEIQDNDGLINKKIRRENFRSSKNDLERSINKSSESCRSADNDSGFDNSMDWEGINDTILRSARDEVNIFQDVEMEWQTINEYLKSDSKERSVYYVVDTNILIHSLQVLKDLSKATVRGFKVKCKIPWQVLKELDNLKGNSSRNISYCARTVIRFLMKAQEDGCNISFESQKSHREECADMEVEVPDDYILKCCLQLMLAKHNVILLSNDNNLRLKASASANIPSGDAEWARGLLNKKDPPETQFENESNIPNKPSQDNCSSLALHKLTKCLYTFLSNIIKQKLQMKYGDLSPLFLPCNKLTLRCGIDFFMLDLQYESYNTEMQEIKRFYEIKTSYDEISAIDVEKLGRKCATLAISMNPNGSPEVLQFLKDLAFLKPWNLLINEDFTYTDGSCAIAKTFIEKMVHKLTRFRESIQNVNSPIDKKQMLNDINKYLKFIQKVVPAFELSLGDNKVDYDAVEVRCLHEEIIEFLEKPQNLEVLPLFSPEDIVDYLNYFRASVNTAPNWLRQLRTDLEIAAKQLSRSDLGKIEIKHGNNSSPLTSVIFEPLRKK